jgi:hypothetical protein
MKVGGQLYSLLSSLKIYDCQIGTLHSPVSLEFSKTNLAVFGSFAPCFGRLKGNNDHKKDLL